MGRLLRFRLRTLLILIAMCALLCGQLGLRFRQFRHEQAIAADWRQIGATVRFGSSWVAMPSVEEVEWQPPTQYSSASLLLAPTEAHLARLAHLPHLHSVLITDGGLSDAQLRHFRGCRQLEFLLLNQMPITDAGLAELAAVPKLETLDLTQTNVTDDGLARLNEQRPELILLDD